MGKNLNRIIFLVASLLISSCGKKLIYFQEKEGSKNKFNNIEVAKPENTRDHIIEAGDILGLKINTTNPALSEEFAKYLTNSSTIPGLLVQENGTLFLPYTGSLKVAGKSITEAEKIIGDELEKSVVNLTIQLTLNSFRVTVLGEVKSAGIKNSPGDRMTIIDALSLSGDLGNDANRKNIKVIRQAGDKKTTYFMDMSSVDVFRSEAYYLKSNDIVYVEPLPRRYIKENITYVSLFLTIVNTLVIIIRLK